MTFQDIFKSSFLDKAADFAILDFVFAMGLSFALGLFIFWVYKKTYRGIMYSAGFGISLMAMCMITTLVILAITSNVVLSLGMVGALSIVRFRTAVKEPMDIAFLFWAIGAGIVLGAGMIPLAVFGSLFVGMILWVFVNRKISDQPYIMIVNCRDAQAEKRVLEKLGECVKKHALKSKTVSGNGIEMTLEIRLKGDDSEFVNEIGALEKVENVVLVSYNGDYMS
ncbi:MAG: DUF4956 domain-containing protein [Lachnospiraceae bacterium]|nr:DUF4956 domain-containing protein [Lachnospiraceae bacterium]MDE6816939.1 DUF4956 domain-containing protein [Lachnospiraceae bacterium]